jgi:peptidoglycan/xylan/chitin deacetylase (PgdA/CDA1 family)
VSVSLRDRAVDLAAGLIARVRGTARHRGDALVLAYHNIVSDGSAPSGDCSLHLPLSRFRAQLDVLQESFDVVPLDAALQESPAGSRPRVAITFDDAYRGAVTLGFDELRRRGLPATVFVAPGLLGIRTTWWDAMAEGWLHDPTAVLRDACLATGASLGDVRALAEADGFAWREAPPELAIATAGELAGAVDAGITVGAHTWDHVNLAIWRDDWTEQQLVAPLRWLRETFPDRWRPWLALPFGLDSEAALAAAGAQGYDRFFFVSGGWRRGIASGGREPRFNVPSGATASRFRLRISIPDRRLRVA